MDERRIVPDATLAAKLCWRVLEFVVRMRTHGRRVPPLEDDGVSSGFPPLRPFNGSGGRDDVGHVKALFLSRSGKTIVERYDFQGCRATLGSQNMRPQAVVHPRCATDELEENEPPLPERHRSDRPHSNSLQIRQAVSSRMRTLERLVHLRAQAAPTPRCTRLLTPTTRACPNPRPQASAGGESKFGRSIEARSRTRPRISRAFPPLLNESRHGRCVIFHARQLISEQLS